MATVADNTDYYLYVSHDGLRYAFEKLFASTVRYRFAKPDIGETRRQIGKYGVSAIPNEVCEILTDNGYEFGPPSKVESNYAQNITGEDNTYRTGEE